MHFVDLSSPEAIQSRTPEAIQSRTPEAIQNPTPEAIQNRTPEAIQSRTPEAIQSRTPEAIQNRTPEAIQSRTPEAIQNPTPTLVPREASQEVECVSKPLFFITFERRRKNRSRGGFRVARNDQMVATTRFPKKRYKTCVSLMILMCLRCQE
jgi:hypothetical protein